MTIFDRPLWDHERQELPDDERTLCQPMTLGNKSKKTDQQRQAENEARQRRGGRQDWREHLKPLPRGYRLAPEETLTKAQKTVRTNSIKAAIAKRVKLQASGGTQLAGYQRPERRVRYAQIVEQERKRKAEGERRLWDPYDLVSSDTRSWEVELRRAVDWFVAAFSGEPEHPEERHWREHREGHKVLAEAYFGNDPEDGWDWTYEVPERGDPDFHRARDWCSPHLPPRFIEVVMETRAIAGF